MNMGELEHSFPNMDYVDAPYRVAFTVAVYTPPAVRQWSRKRRLRWRRRYVRQALGMAKTRVKSELLRMRQTMYKCELVMGTLTERPNRTIPILFKRSDYRGIWG
jgi:hypothetical protein